MTDEVEVDVDVLGTAMERGILGQVNSTLVVAIASANPGHVTEHYIPLCSAVA